MDLMLSLALLAGWRTVIHPEDTAVVRLALTTARQLHNPDAGGSATLSRFVDAIELQWLDEDDERQAELAAAGRSAALQPVALGSSRSAT